jgi:hypothetical protein
MNYQTYLEHRLAQGVNFSIRQAISDGFSYFGKNMGAYIGYTFVSVLLMAMAGGIAGVIPFQIGSYAVQAVLSPAIVMGYAIYCRKAETNDMPEFGNFFDGFKRNYSQLVIANVILVIVTAILTLVLILPYTNELLAMMSGGDFAMDPDMLAEIGQDFLATFLENWWMFLIYVVALYVIQILYLQVNYFVVFYEYGFWEALESSRVLMSKVFFKTVLYFIVISLLLAVGTVVTFGLGLLFLYPAVMLMSYSVFEQVAGFDETEMQLEDDLII